MGSSSFTESILLSLQNAIKSCTNFKVRIAAALALNEVQPLDRFGETNQQRLDMLRQTILILKTSLKNLDESSVSFDEFKYQDQLKKTLESTLVKLVNLDS